MKKIVVILSMLFATQVLANDSVGVIQYGMEFSKLKEMCSVVEKLSDNKYKIALKKDYIGSFMFPSDFYEIVGIDNQGKVISVSQSYGMFSTYKGYYETYGLLLMEEIYQGQKEPIYFSSPNVPDLYMKSNRNPTLDVVNDEYKLDAMFVNDNKTRMVILTSHAYESGVLIEKLVIWGPQVKNLLNQ